MQNQLLLLIVVLCATVTALTTTVTTITNRSKQYRDRDDHEALFRPTAKPRKYNSSKNKKKKHKGLADNQRVKEVHAHWIIHHDTVKDEKKFLNQKVNTDNVSANTSAALTLMITNNTTC